MAPKVKTIAKSKAMKRPSSSGRRPAGGRQVAAAPRSGRKLLKLVTTKLDEYNACVVVSKMCRCGLRQPYFGHPGERPVCCASCRDDGMVDVVHKRCQKGIQQKIAKHLWKKAAKTIKTKMQKKMPKNMQKKMQEKLPNKARKRFELHPKNRR